MSEWKLIETAPTWKWDGDRNIFLGKPEIIIGWAGSRQVALAYWSPVHESGGGGGRWTIDGADYAAPPTHWMPLPEPPALTDQASPLEEK